MTPVQAALARVAILATGLAVVAMLMALHVDCGAVYAFAAGIFTGVGLYVIHADW